VTPRHQINLLIQSEAQRPECPSAGRSQPRWERLLACVSLTAATFAASCAEQLPGRSEVSIYVQGPTGAANPSLPSGSYQSRATAHPFDSNVNPTGKAPK
jgi:hypothetical protein